MALFFPLAFREEHSAISFIKEIYVSLNRQFVSRKMRFYTKFTEFKVGHLR
jgi:hypothetical protein